MEGRKDKDRYLQENDDCIIKKLSIPVETGTRLFLVFYSIDFKENFYPKNKFVIH